MAPTTPPIRDIHILVLNPNSSSVMSDGMKNAIAELPLSNSIRLDYYTAPPTAPGSIDDMEGITASASAVKNDSRFREMIANTKYDAILVACYSVHQLVPLLSAELSVPVTGIFEASISTSLALLPDATLPDKWGIVTTGAFWEDHLSAGVRAYLGQPASSDNQRFAGVYTTGLNAGDFHDIAPEEVEKRLRNATRKLLESAQVGCVVMGCAGMAGLEAIIRSTAQEVYGADKAKQVYVVDGVKAGILQLEQTVRSQRAFQ
jgi:Asp/Glu/hydantoin racemase